MTEKLRLEVESFTSHLSRKKMLNKYFCLKEEKDWLLPHQVQQPSDNSFKCRGGWAALSNGLSEAEISLSHRKQLSEVDKGLSVGTFKEEKILPGHGRRHHEEPPLDLSLVAHD